MISIIIPCFNAEEFIKETLDSILSQDEETIEVIVVDDGSTDKSASIVRSYNDARIIYCPQSNQGVSVARNKGFLRANGEFVVFFDADDKMSSEFLKERKKVLLNNPVVGFCCGPVNAFPVKQDTSFGIAENVAEALLTLRPPVFKLPL
jgi:glycosyltransferase involved in cell wall biosynthesis